MKIDGVGSAGKGADEPKKVDQKPSGEPFEAVLKSTMAQKPVKVAPVTGPVPVMPVHSPVATGTAVQTEALSRLESLLEDVEFYRNTLQNEDIPLSRLKPMTEALMGKKEKLVSMLPHLDDPEIKDFITQAAALVINENSRYNLV